MIANVINRTRNISTPVIHDGDPIPALDYALGYHGAHEIAEGQVEIHCDKDFADKCASKLVPTVVDGEETQVAPFAKNDDGTHFAYSYRGVPVLVQ